MVNSENMIISNSSSVNDNETIDIIKEAKVYFDGDFVGKMIN